MGENEESIRTPVLDPAVEKPEPERIAERPRNRMMTKEEKAKFRAEVALLRENGYTFDQITKHTGRSMSTCHAAYKSFMVEFAKLHHADQAVLLGEFHQRMEKAWRAYMAKFQQSRTEDPKKVGNVALLREAARIQCDFFDRAQSAGLIKTETLKLEHTGEVKETITFNQFVAALTKKNEGK